jgi:hypothetical protein
VLDLRPRVPVDWRAFTTRDPSAIVWGKEFNEILKYCRRRIGDLTAEEIEELRKIMQEVPPESHHGKVLKNYGEALEARSLGSQTARHCARLTHHVEWSFLPKLGRIRSCC